MEILRSLWHPVEMYNLFRYRMGGHGTVMLEPDSMSESLQICYRYLNESGRSFAAVIQALDGELRHAVCIFYLILRALDTVEDDMTISLETKIPMLLNFHTFLYDPEWKFTESKDKNRQMLEDFPTISLEFRNLAAVYQEVIVDVCRRSGMGLAEFLVKKVETLEDLDKFGHCSSGLIIIGLSHWFSAFRLEDPIIGEDTQLSRAMGIVLQKANTIRDFLEDQIVGREFWPTEVWSKYATKLSDFTKPEHILPAVRCMNELITNALQHVPDVLTYLSRLKNPSIFRFCAIPQVMAIATLAVCYNNQQVFKGRVKIRKGQAVTLIMDATNIQAVKAIMFQYVEEVKSLVVQWSMQTEPWDEIYQKISLTDPCSDQTQHIILSIQKLSKSSASSV